MPARARKSNATVDSDVCPGGETHATPDGHVADSSGSQPGFVQRLLLARLRLARRLVIGTQSPVSIGLPVRGAGQLPRLRMPKPVRMPQWQSVRVPQWRSERSRGGQRKAMFPWLAGGDRRRSGPDGPGRGSSAVSSGADTTGLRIGCSSTSAAGGGTGDERSGDGRSRGGAATPADHCVQKCAPAAAGRAACVGAGR
jgi:hypothetical protein